jgi:hypothetical protein
MESFDLRVGFYINPTLKGSYNVRIFVPSARISKKHVRFVLPAMNTVIQVVGTLIGTVQETFEPAVLMEDVYRLSLNANQTPTSTPMKKIKEESNAMTTSGGKWDFGLLSPRNLGESSNKRRRSSIAISDHDSELNSPMSPTPLSVELLDDSTKDSIQRKGGRVRKATAKGKERANPLANM